MSEEQIERMVEIKTNRLDDRYMSGEMTEADYKNALREIDAWAEEQLRAQTLCRLP